MTDPIKKALADDPVLLKKYEESERRYFDSISEDVVTMELTLDLTEEEIKILAGQLLEADMCFDEWAARKILALIDAKRSDEAGKKMLDEFSRALADYRALCDS